jgi:transglutaminase-like putative cysteine protease
MISSTRLLLPLILVFTSIQLNARANKRSIDITYRADITTIPDTAERIALWLPLPASHENQTVTSLRFSGSHDYSILFEETFQNRFLYIEINVTKTETLQSMRDEKPWLQIDATVIRKAYNKLDSKFTMHNPGGDLGKFLQPSALIPIDGVIEKEATKTIGKETSPIKQADLLYQNIVSTVTYDKTGDGWGRGDATYACEIRTGNCTDFHSLFIGEARSIKIPARFLMGFPLPPDKTEGTIQGYHCWAEFFTQSNGWVPIDASEAQKHPEKRKDFFGGLDEHRIEFTSGRDIVLPKSVSGAVNYSIFPHLEINGKHVDTVKSTLTFKDSENKYPNG